MVFYVPSSGIILNSLRASIATPASWIERNQNETKTVLENCLKLLDSHQKDKERLSRRDGWLRPLRESKLKL